MYQSRLREGGGGGAGEKTPQKKIKKGGGFKKLTACEGRLLITTGTKGG